MIEPERCPWDGLDPATMHFCERELCAWIEQPANTWSNLAYLAAGLYVLAKHRGAPELQAIGVIAISVFVGSSFFHASSTFAGELVDLGAMFLFSSYVLVRNLARVAPSFAALGARAELATLLAITAASIGLMLVERPIGVAAFSTQMVLAGALEIRAYRKGGDAERRISRRPLALLLTFFGAAWTAWWLDLLGVACDPDLHLISGHAVWHVLNSACFPCLAAFYAQLRPRA